MEQASVKFLVMLLGVFMSMTDLVASAKIENSQANGQANGQVIVYEHCDYKGKNSSVGVGAWNMNHISKTVGNDMISSIKVPDNLKVTLYEHANFKGKSIVLTKNTSCLVGLKFNDVVSSMKVEKMTTTISPKNEEQGGSSASSGGNITAGLDANLLKQWSPNVIARANTAQNASYMTDEEKRVIFLCNLARIDGKKFAETFLKAHVGNSSNSYITSLYYDLNKTKNLHVYVPYRKLFDAAQYHAKDMGGKGIIGHDSSNGTSFSKRLRGYAKGGAIAENCSYGNSDAVGIVIQLLIDQDVPSLGHRKNILSKTYKSIGVAIAPHKKWQYNCVQDFSDYVPENE